MPIELSVDPTSDVAPFEQIRAQLAAAITAGHPVAGTRLATVRALAEELGLAVNTVAKAYRALESAGMVETRGRGGTFVTAAGDDARARLQALAVKYATLAHDVGVDAREAVEIVHAALASAH